MTATDFEGVRACRDRILGVLSDGEMTRTQLVRKCSAHPSDRFRQALDMLVDSGKVAVKLQGVGRRTAQVVSLQESAEAPSDPLLVKMRPEVVAVQGECVERVNRWLLELEADKTNAIMWSAKLPMVLAARDMLVEMHRSPWKYAAETPLGALVGDVAESRGDAPAMKAARKLAAMGAIVLKERRGRGRTSTFRLAHVPPYPMG